MNESSHLVPLRRVVEFPMGDEILRPQSNLVQRIEKDELILIATVEQYSEFGSLPTLMSALDWEKSWKSAASTDGISEMLVEFVDQSIDLWSLRLDLSTEDLESLEHGRLKVRDRVRVNNGIWWGVPSYLYSRARQLDEQAQSVLARYSFGYAVTAMADPAHSVKVEALANNHSAVAAVINEARFWRADGSPNTQKIRKVLRDQISPVLGGLTERQIGALSVRWRTIGNPSQSRSERGLRFEAEVRDLLLCCGLPAETTAMSGDFGVDVIVRVPELSLAIQVKDFAGPVGISAVQEVTAGAHHYNCTSTLVISSNGFTEAAQVLAKSTGTRLETVHSLRQYLRAQLVSRIGGT